MKWSCRYYWYTAAADLGPHPHLPREEDQNLHRHHQGSKQVSAWLSSVTTTITESHCISTKKQCLFVEIQCRLFMVHLCTFPNSHFRVCLMLFSLSSSSSRAVGGVPTSVFYPVVTWVLLLVVLAYWAVVALYPTNYTTINI